MSGRRWAVVGAVSFLTASAPVGAQLWSTPNVYCSIGTSFCLDEYFAFALSPARYDGLFGAFPRFFGIRSGEDVGAGFKFEDVLRDEEEEDVAPPTPDIPRDLVPEVPDVGVPDPPRNEEPDPPRNEEPDPPRGEEPNPPSDDVPDTPRDEHPDIPGDPTPHPDPHMGDPILAPEPSTLVLLGATLPFAIGFIRGRRKRR